MLHISYSIYSFYRPRSIDWSFFEVCEVEKVMSLRNILVITFVVIFCQNGLGQNQRTNRQSLFAKIIAEVSQHLSVLS